MKTEDDPLDPAPVPAMRETNAAMRYLDETVLAAGGIALRYGGFYGAANDGMVEPVRRRLFAGAHDRPPDQRAAFRRRCVRWSNRDQSRRRR